MRLYLGGYFSNVARIVSLHALQEEGGGENGQTQADLAYLYRRRHMGHH